VDVCLYKWSPQKCSERVPLNGVILKAQAVQQTIKQGWDI
jgi:hypothetical protein